MSTRDTHITILLVEDDPDHVELIRRSFRGDPDRFSLQIATSVADAQAAFADATPSIVIADWHLPDGDGLSLLPTLPGRPPIPLLIMSSHADARLEKNAHEAGAAGFIEKSETAFSNMHHTVEKVITTWLGTRNN